MRDQALANGCSLVKALNSDLSEHFVKIHDKTSSTSNVKLADSDSDGAKFDQDYDLSSDTDTESEQSRPRSRSSGSGSTTSRSMFSLNFAQEARNSGQLGSGPQVW